MDYAAVVFPQPILQCVVEKLRYTAACEGVYKKLSTLCTRLSPDTLWKVLWIKWITSFCDRFLHRSSKRKGTHLIRARRGQGLAAYGQTAGVFSFLSPPRTRQFPAEFQRKTPCPDRVNRLHGSSAAVDQRKIMDSCRCSTNTTCRSTPNLLQ